MGLGQAVDSEPVLRSHVRMTTGADRLGNAFRMRKLPVLGMAGQARNGRVGGTGNPLGLIVTP